MTSIVIDTDPGHDDAIALLYALASEGATVEQVTTVAGNAQLEDTTRNAGTILSMAGREDVPLAAGRERPLERDLETAQVHGDDGLDGLEADIRPVPATENGVEALAEAAANGATIVTLGPLTNVAAAIREHPETMEDATIVSMGGAIESPGNQNRVAEYNMYVDPEAARTVIESDVDTTIVPLGPCNDILFDRPLLERLQETAIGDKLVPMLEAYQENLDQFLDVGGVLIYDAVAMYAALHKDRVTTEQHDIVVETDGTHTRGMLVPDDRPYTRSEPNTDVITHIETDTCRETILSALEEL